jgi:HSP20 family protein
MDWTNGNAWRDDWRDPWSPLRDLRAGLDRVFQQTFAGEAGLAGAGAAASVPLNVWETADALHAEAELPGVASSDLEVTVEGDELSIRGARTTPLAEGQSFLHRERSQGTFQRSIRLPFAVDADAVEARLEQGVLTVTLPKAKALRPRRVAVQS